MVDLQATLDGLGEPFDLGRLTARGSVDARPSMIGRSPSTCAASREA
jgi:hypothetical protein